MKALTNVVRKLIKHFEDAPLRRAKQIRARTARDMLYIHREENAGLIKARLFNMPEVNGGDITSSWATSIRLYMDDGYEVSVFSTDFRRAAFEEVAREVARRINKKYPIRGAK